MVADAISRLRIFRLYQDNNNEEVQLSLKGTIENIIEEILNVESTPNTPAYTKTDKLNLDLLRREQVCNKFCKRKLKEIKTKPDPSFFLDENGILKKAVKLKYTVEPTIEVPRNLTNIIILEFHNGKGHQGISQTVNMMRYF